MSVLNKPVLGRMILVVLASVFALVGCGKETVTDSSQLVSVAEDPLDGALNSTLGFTPADPGQRIDRIAEALGLDEAQKEAFAAAYAEFRTGLEAIRDQVVSGELSWEEARAQTDALRDAFEAKLQVILTPEQYDQLQEMRAAARHGGRHHGRNHLARWDDWLEQIGANEEQITAIQAGLEALHEGLMDLRDRVRSGDLPREEAWAEAKALRELFDTLLQEVLTEEQYAQLLELRPDCPHRRP